AVGLDNSHGAGARGGACGRVKDISVLLCGRRRDAAGWCREYRPCNRIGSAGTDLLEPDWMSLTAAVPALRIHPGA
ncbi:MAG: hypothetical protein OXP66_10805, partial [Candidatus Tectomicrobia bacterium]|nr:hypothetical protein [Candidatus Tectomicrobia bacterium]